MTHITIMSSPMLESALWWAENAGPVFPLRPHGKTPLTAHGCKDATRDDWLIRAMWAQYPDANIGLATGIGSVDVLDVDVKPSGNGWDAYSRLKSAGLLKGAYARTVTRNGGLHVYYAGTAQGNHSSSRLYLDFRSAGGYVVVPPSIVPADIGPGAYSLIDRWTPTGIPVSWDALRNFLIPPEPKPARTHDGNITGLARRVGSAVEGERNNVLYWASRRAVEQGLPVEPLIDAAVNAGLDYRDASRTAESARRSA